MNKSFALITFLTLVCLRPSANAQITIAQDDCEAYSGGNYTDENQGSGFTTAFQFKLFGTSDMGGEYIETGSRKISGNQSFGLYANTSGTGKAVSRSPNNPISLLHRISFRIRFDLNTNAGKTAGFVICSTPVVSQTYWNDGQRLFMGISGDGLWKYDDGALKTVTSGGGNFSCTGGDIYLVELDIIPLTNNYYFLITNLTTATTSDIISGTLGGATGSAIQSIGFGNGVIGTNQNLIFDDIVFIENPANPLPVELMDFEATALPEGVLLKWKTASERENSHFDIERSTDLRHWTHVGSVLGVGTTDQTTHYTYLDAHPEPGLNYYRLAQVDNDGSRSFFRVVAVRVADMGAPVIAPNPVTNSLFVKLPEDLQQLRPTAILTDGLGRVLSSWSPLATTEHQLEAPPGIYFLKIVDDKGRTLAVEKLVKN